MVEHKAESISAQFDAPGVARIGWDCDFAQEEALLGEHEIADPVERPQGTLVYPQQPASDAAAPSTLVFNTNFKCGSLKSAEQIGPQEFVLRLRPDLNTNGYCSWFFFSFGPVCAATPYRFHLAKCGAMSRLYRQGKRFLLYSRSTGKWVRAGTNISVTAEMPKPARTQRRSVGDDRLVQ